MLEDKTELHLELSKLSVDCSASRETELRQALQQRLNNALTKRRKELSGQTPQSKNVETSAGMPRLLAPRSGPFPREEPYTQAKAIGASIWNCVEVKSLQSRAKFNPAAAPFVSSQESRVHPQLAKTGAKGAGLHPSYSNESTVKGASALKNEATAAAVTPGQPFPTAPRNAAGKSQRARAKTHKAAALQAPGNLSTTTSTRSSSGSLTSVSTLDSEVGDIFEKFKVGHAPKKPAAQTAADVVVEKCSVPQLVRKSPRDLEPSEAKATSIDLGAISRGAEQRCTVMVQNIPNKLEFHEFKRFIDSTSWGKYDFLYLRFDFINRCNVGYAFVSFTHPRFVKEFVEARQDMSWRQCRHKSQKVLDVRYAKLQGIDKLYEKFRHSSVMLQEESFRPHFYYTEGAQKGQERRGFDM